MGVVVVCLPQEVLTCSAGDCSEDVGTVKVVEVHAWEIHCCLVTPNTWRRSKVVFGEGVFKAWVDAVEWSDV
jgi:hypothetical protein